MCAPKADSSVAGAGRSGPYTETLLGKMNCLMPSSAVRLTSVTASITRAVPATLICHMRSTSSTPVRTGSITKARWTTAKGCVSRSSSKSFRVEDSCPRSRLSNCSSESVWGGVTSTPITEKLPSSGNNLDPRLPETPVTTTTGLAISLFEVQEAVPTEVAPLGPSQAYPAVDGAFAVAASDPRRPVRNTLRWKRN